MSNTQQSKI